MPGPATSSTSRPRLSCFETTTSGKFWQIVAKAVVLRPRSRPIIRDSKRGNDEEHQGRDGHSGPGSGRPGSWSPISADSRGNWRRPPGSTVTPHSRYSRCLLYTSDAADDLLCVDL